MLERPNEVSSFVTALLPTLSRSLEEEFNLFRVMHHGTHEKQVSNVFSWLLSPGATHDLGDAVQRIFLDIVNSCLPKDGQLPVTGYTVSQEVDTRGAGEESGRADIADLLLSRSDAAVIVENYGTSDGHGHDYRRYRAHAEESARAAAVVLLCHRREAHLQRDGWEQAVVVTYADVLEPLQAYIARNQSWAREHPEQNFFIQQMDQYFVGGPAAVNLDDQITFIKAMCDSGESARYGYRPHERAAQEFADLVAEHARRQFDDSRKTLGAVKTGLRAFAQSTLLQEVNERLEEGQLLRAEAKFVGKWEWCVHLPRPDPHQDVFLVFGPTAVEELATMPEELIEPDYSRVFVSSELAAGLDRARFVQTDVGIDEVINGLPRDDMRLRDAVLEIIDRRSRKVPGANQG